MKSFVLLLGLLFSTASFAFPNVGDFAKYDLIIQYPDGSVQKGTTESKITSYQRATDEFTIVTTTQIDSQRKTEEELYTTRRLLEIAGIIKSIFQNCESNSGVREQLTVPAGTFQTCKVNDVHYVDLPIAFAKGVFEESEYIMTQTLVSYKFQ